MYQQFQLEELEKLRPDVIVIQQESTQLKMEVQSGTQLFNVGGEEIKLTETRWTYEVEELINEYRSKADDEPEGMKEGEVTDSEDEDDDDKVASAEEPQPEPVQVKIVEAEGPQRTKVMNKKPLPFDPAKMKAAAAQRSKGANAATLKSAAGNKPTGARKRPLNSTTAKQRAPKRFKKNPTLDDVLYQARRWLVPQKSWMLRNPETGCFGMSVRHREGERTELTIAHTIDCECLDVRLLHICQHAEDLVKKKSIARRSRDAFVIASKIRLDLELSRPIPEELRFPPVPKQDIRRRKREVKAEDRVIPVVDVHRQQRLVEKWKNLEAYKARRIWKDW
ncbi:hypothetical protein GGR55DRAFT_430927 [Xylaria sp. FL0064]|nr:hypothetical protein GGR55DRAFT_430927 [Xylaria sp. FL0064]